MAIYRKYQCPDCQGVFRFLHHPNTEPPPKFCPLCGADVSGEKKQRKPRLKKADHASLPDDVRPSVRRTATKSVDGLYRQMESASENRMQDAAELLGVDARSLSAMKMTNMKDNLREGDMSMSTTPSAAAQIMGSTTTDAGLTMQFQDNSAAAEYAKATRVGPNPLAGNKTRELVTSSHAMRQQRVVSAGRLNTKESKS